jgi:hypothetical protein
MLCVIMLSTIAQQNNVTSADILKALEDRQRQLNNYEVHTTWSALPPSQAATEQHTFRRDSTNRIRLSRRVESHSAPKGTPPHLQRWRSADIVFNGNSTIIRQGYARSSKSNDEPNGSTFCTTIIPGRTPVGCPQLSCDPFTIGVSRLVASLRTMGNPLVATPTGVIGQYTLEVPSKSTSNGAVSTLVATVDKTNKWAPVVIEERDESGRTIQIQEFQYTSVSGVDLPIPSRIIVAYFGTGQQSESAPFKWKCEIHAANIYDRPEQGASTFDVTFPRGGVVWDLRTNALFTSDNDGLRASDVADHDKWPKDASLVPFGRRTRVLQWNLRPWLIAVNAAMVCTVALLIVRRRLKGGGR